MPAFCRLISVICEGGIIRGVWVFLFCQRGAGFAGGDAAACNPEKKTGQ